MSKLHFIVGIIAIAALVVVGIATALVRVVEGVMIGVVLAVISPFVFRYMKRVRKHDER